MTPTAALALQVLACAAVIGWAGYLLSASTDRLAQAYGWGRGWAGVALLATVTSLPELVAGVSAVTWVDAPDLAVGNALGACVLNLAFLVLVDALQRDPPLYPNAAAGHLVSAGFGVVMLGFAALSLLLAHHAPRLLHASAYTPALLLLYLLALRSVHGHDRPTPAAGATVVGAAERRRAWRDFGTAAALVVLAGIWLPEAADRLATASGLGRGEVGTVLMALITTLPELAVTLSALRLRAPDLAVGNLLGSSLFNVAILAIDDLAYPRGPLLADASPLHAATAATAATMSGLVVIGLAMRPAGRVLRGVTWVSIGLAAAYLTTIAAAIFAR